MAYHFRGPFSFVCIWAFGPSIGHPVLHGRSTEEGVTEVSGIPVAKMEVGEVTWEGGWTTELVTELGKVT